MTPSQEKHTHPRHNKYKVQQQLYHLVREQHKLPAQLTIRAISKVVESYGVERRRLHIFDPHGAIVYDQRIMSFKGLDKVSLVTVEGRVRLRRGGLLRQIANIRLYQSKVYLPNP